MKSGSDQISIFDQNCIIFCTCDPMCQPNESKWFENIEIWLKKYCYSLIDDGSKTEKNLVSRLLGWPHRTNFGRKSIFRFSVLCDAKCSQTSILIVLRPVKHWCDHLKSFFAKIEKFDFRVIFGHPTLFKWKKLHLGVSSGPNQYMEELELGFKHILRYLHQKYTRPYSR